LVQKNLGLKAFRAHRRTGGKKRNKVESVNKMEGLKIESRYGKAMTCGGKRK